MKNIVAAIAVAVIGTTTYLVAQAPSAPASSADVPTVSVTPAVEGASTCRCGPDCDCVDCPCSNQYSLNIPEIVTVPTPAVEPEPEIVPELAEPEPASPAYLTTAQIRSWIADHYTRGQSLRWGVNPSSAVWSHLQDGNEGTHVWRADQVSGLSQWEALALHDATHRGLITPTSPVSFSDAPDGIAVVYRNNRYEWSHGGTTWYSSRVREGYTYGGRRFEYRAGRMHALDQPAVTVTRERTVTRTYSNSGGCANGQCARPRMFGRWRR